VTGVSRGRTIGGERSVRYREDDIPVCVRDLNTCLVRDPHKSNNGIVRLNWRTIATQLSSGEKRL